jgi:hypothetical protein
MFGMGSLLWAILHHGDWLAGLVLAVATAVLTLGVRLVFCGYGKRGRDLKDAAIEDTRRPVLYLRNFADESRQFLARGIRMPANTGLLTVVSAFAHGGVPTHEMEPLMTLEAYFAAAIEDNLGRFVALGNPDDYFSSTGAAREYCAEADWLTRFHELSAEASAILLSPGYAGSLRWELDPYYVRD